MKLWHGAVILPVSAVAAGLGYDLYKRLSGTVETSSATVAAPVRSTARKTSLPLQDRITVVELFGPIQGGQKSSDYVNLIDSLRVDKRVRAVVLEIDSPGGSAPASDYLYRSVARLAADKPVIAFVRGLGASGAYMVSCAATKIVALPGSIVGSIGVISVNPVMKDLLSRIGIEMTVTKSGPYKDMGAFYRDATEEEREKQKELVTQFFDDFVELVAAHRNLSVDEVRELATGEIYTGKQARENGLVDELGDMETALDLASKLGNVEKRVAYARPHRPLLQRIASRFTASLVEEVSANLERRLSRAVYYRS